MPLINTVERETRRILKEMNMQPQLVMKIDKKLSTGAIKRLTYWTKKLITYFHFTHPAFQPLGQLAIAMPSDKVKKAFLKVHSLPDADFILAWGMMYTIFDHMVRNYAGKRKPNVLTSENVDDAARYVLNAYSERVGENIMMKMSNQRSPSEKRSGKSSKKSRRCSSGKHYRRSYRSSSGKRVRGKCVKNSRSHSRRHSRK